MLPRFLLRSCRRALLAYGRTVSPQALLQRSARGAVDVARATAERSPAYRQLLQECGLRAPLRADTPLQALPVLNKGNTFGRFSVQELAGPLHPGDLADVLTSSGRGGTTFGIRLSTRKAHERAWFDIDLGLQEAFDIDRRPTLIVNCLPMGVVFPSRAATVANVSVREDMACAVLRSAGASFAQTIVCTDPLFVNRLLDHADASGLDWAALNTSMVLGEEVLVESQRDYIAGRLGIALDTAPGQTHRMVASSFGIGELALNLLFETRETIALRRALRRLPAAAAALCGQGATGALPAIFCFNPLRCHIEALQPEALESHGLTDVPAHAHAHAHTQAQADDDAFGELCFTLLDRNAVIALPRYTTGDLGRLIDPALAAWLCAQAGVPVPWLPMIALHGRIADRAAAGLSAEDVKEAIYADPALAKELTGAFRLQRGNSQGAGRLRLQARPGAAPARPTALHELSGRLAAGGAPHIDVAIVAADEFHGRPVLDYERKFRYVADND